jgi:antirestriction protein ArdC
MAKAKKTTKKSTSKRSSKPKVDAYQAVTDRLVELLEQGVCPWAQPWKNRGSGFAPVNASTKKSYRGVNIWILLAEQCDKGYGANAWVTYKQAQAMGGNVRKGQKGTRIVFWRILERESNSETKKDGSPKVDKIPLIRLYTVFNVEQCDGLDFNTPAQPEELPEFNPIEAAEAIAAEYKSGPSLEHGGDRACYSPALDRVQMPKREQFDGAAAYYSTLFHEYAHSTGHKSRLDRDLENGAGFGSDPYAKEELVAELAAAFLCGEAGIDNDTIERSAAYLSSWARRLKGDSRLIVQASSAAQKAADRIMGVDPAAAKKDGESAAQAA